ncbi:MAG: hypothetical protein IKL53_09210, partial [Lachnospiraceae bacterium]|nr:hypothetical protein [Lachnospiraceae bacterium]
DIKVVYLNKNRYRLPETFVDREEFYNNWDEDTLSQLSVVVDKKATAPYSTCCYKEDELWHIAGTNNDDELIVVESGDEAYIFTKLDKLVRLKISLRDQRDLLDIDELMNQLT